MVDVKSDKICRLEIIIDHAERLKAFVAEYNKKYGLYPSWGDPLDKFIRASKNKHDNAIVSAYKKAKKDE